jgi:hypothetical protein
VVCPVDGTDNIIGLCIDKKIQVIDNSVCSSKLISSSANTQNGRYVYLVTTNIIPDGSVFLWLMVNQSHTSLIIQQHNVVNI